MAAGSAGSAALIIGKLPVGARAIGLSGACTAVLDDPSAVWWNPASLARIPRMRVGLMHTEQGHDIRMENLLTAFPVIAGTVGLSGSYLGMPPIVEELEDASGNYIGAGGEMEVFEFKGAAGFGGYLAAFGRPEILGPLWELGAVGVNVTILGERIGPQRNNSASMDIGYLLDDASNGRRLGLVVRQVGQKSRGTPLPVTGQAGVSQETGDWLLSADMLTAWDDAYRLRLGAEWTMEGEGASVSLRGGAQHSFASTLLARLSAGLEYRMPLPGGTQAQFEYSYVPVEEFDDMHAMSVGLSF